MDDLSYINSSDPAIVEELYRQYKNDPDSVGFGWKKFFEGFEFSKDSYHTGKDQNITPSEFKVLNMIEDFRKRGHLFTRTNPVRTRRKYSPTLDIGNYGLTTADLNKFFDAGHEIGIGKATLAAIIEFLNQTYCQSIGAEFVYIRNTEVVSWIKNRMESTRNIPAFTKEEKIQILTKLSEAVGFEKFIHTKFPGQKRFSLQGGESLIPALDAVIEKGVSLGIEEFVIGMPHRGRLNVLANIMGKSYKEIFSEFEGIIYDDEALLGDVKYHLGFTSVRRSQDNKNIKITLAPNPSHLEAVIPVVEGIVRARIDQLYNGDCGKIVPILIHGDASIAAQGVVYEVLQMSGLEGYKTGGTIHLVVNNQLGFTTNYLDGRTSTYCTDVAKTVQSPIFHVNGDDVEAVAFIVQLAMEFRKKFSRDVFVDLLGYRKYGHNEGDEPRFTQPVLYKIIEKHPDPRTIYIEKLVSAKTIDNSLATRIEEDFYKTLEASLSASKEIKKATINSFLAETWEDISRAVDEDFNQSPETNIDRSLFLELGKKITTLPANKAFFRKTIKLHEERQKMFEGTGRIDWATAELLALASLLYENFPVRFSGQDSQRGTFSQRHAVLTLEDSEEKYTPLNNLSSTQAKIEILNSPLSEYGVLGFEYGYALSSPLTLTIWEAQFGDFANGAQIIFDQYMSSAEDKWNVMNDLVVLLPHGYEGQGPEHSSARIERFLTLCAENNLQLANCSTPASYFHILRRQLHRKFRKPLIIFTPKSLLRHPRCISPMDDFTNGGFVEVIDDNNADAAKVTRVVFCSGKVYYDLLAEKEKLRDEITALVRIEQLYPLPILKVKDILSKYTKVSRTLWVQEEPVNMGAWHYIHELFFGNGIDIKVIARPASGSPATGSPGFHEIRQRKIVSKTFEECICPRLKEECKMVCIGNKWQSYEKELQISNQVN